ncbi:hypothetical protein GM418_22470 [Maribellus comscasis]|uniref:Uncharacterized protein n=1 Tax=Maribellus comscasis TaxID=2681766 RepID=A0A6I6JTE8_9BACT|nr:hypothetical protein [Maribellus comscasis]QGY46325.1 hypothetical protein GM418_22470 [Maribellus comscasis]
MHSKINFSGLIKWLGSTEMFARPSKKLPGKWLLFEFYHEPENELIHISKDQLKAENFFWEIEFDGNENYSHNTNLDVPLISKIVDGTWSRTRNFITLVHPNNFRDNVEFQFAIERENLKLLKKDALGRIEFFGFFQRELAKE